LPAPTRTCISILAFCLVRALAAAFVFAAVIVGGVLSFAGNQRYAAQAQNRAAVGSQVFSGVVTDSQCGARHDRYPDASSAECVRACVRSGGRYVLVNGDSSYFLEGNTAELSRFAGQRVRITGRRQNDTVQVGLVTVE